MEEMHAFLVEKFDFEVPQRCQPAQVHRQLGCQPEIKPAKTPPAGLSTRDHRCACSGNCGLQPCTKRINLRRKDETIDICENSVEIEGSFCHRCICECKSCGKAKSKATRRWCIAHARENESADYVSGNGRGKFDDDETPAWKVMLRFNYLHGLLNPDDNLAWQEVCDEFNPPQAGSLMDPHGVVTCVLAHAMKWPPAVRQFQINLRHLVKPCGAWTRGYTGALLLDAFYDTVTWADGKPPFKCTPFYPSQEGPMH